MKQKAVGYVRVSSKEQKQEGYSIPAQRRLLRDFADQNDIEHGEGKLRLKERLDTAKNELQLAIKRKDDDSINFWKDEIKDVNEGCPKRHISVQIRSLNTTVYAHPIKEEIMNQSIKDYYRLMEKGTVRPSFIGNEDVKILSDLGKM